MYDSQQSLTSKTKVGIFTVHSLIFKHPSCTCCMSILVKADLEITTLRGVGL